MGIVFIRGFSFLCPFPGWDVRLQFIHRTLFHILYFRIYPFTFCGQILQPVHPGLGCHGPEYRSLPAPDRNVALGIFSRGNGHGWPYNTLCIFSFKICIKAAFAWGDGTGYQFNTFYSSGRRPGCTVWPHYIGLAGRRYHSCWSVDRFSPDLKCSCLLTFFHLDGYGQRHCPPNSRDVIHDRNYWPASHYSYWIFSA